MKTRKIMSLLLSLAMMATTVVSVSAAAIDTDTYKPTLTVKAESIDSEGYATIVGYVSLDKALTEVVEKRGKTSGEGIRTLQVDFSFDGDVYDTSEIYPDKATTKQWNASAALNEVSAGYNVAFGAPDSLSMNCTLANPLFKVEALLKDTSMTVKDLNTKNLINVSKFIVEILEFDGTGSVPATETTWSSDGKNDFVPTVVIGEKPTIEVKDPVITGVTIDPVEATVAGGATQQFTADVAGENGINAEGNEVPYDKTVVWTATAGTIDANGLFTAPAETEEVQAITVTATAGDKTATATVTVPAKEVPPKPEAAVEVTDAVKTQNEVYAARKTMYWGVQFTNGVVDPTVKLVDTTAEEEKAVTLGNLEGLTVNGDATFAVYMLTSEARLNNAIKLVATNGEATAESTAVAYSALN